ncbi:hypothetical protein XELAEV_18025403mg [Xenopus laevis]|uniref:Uncharacterized protein n=1 Tax=Xenopus laevis TaxID=8355 RepID=A0A974CZR0_XENLA|nr:hypothetical protein XELAEV_18025403mg [Xenopus laevis]
MTGWKKVLAEIGIVLLIVSAFCTMIFCCFIPCIRKLCLASQYTPTFVLSSPTFYVGSDAHAYSNDTPEDDDNESARVLDDPLALPYIPTTVLSQYIPLAPAPTPVPPPTSTPLLRSG